MEVTEESSAGGVKGDLCGRIPPVLRPAGKLLFSFALACRKGKLHLLDIWLFSSSVKGTGAWLEKQQQRHLRVSAELGEKMVSGQPKVCVFFLRLPEVSCNLR